MNTSSTSTKTSNNRLDLRWIRGIQDRQEAEGRAQSIINALNSDPNFKRLREIVDERLSQLDRLPLEPDAYDNPSWSHKQAHINGMYAALINIRKLLTHE